VITYIVHLRILSLALLDPLAIITSTMLGNFPDCSHPMKQVPDVSKSITWDGLSEDQVLLLVVRPIDAAFYPSEGVLPLSLLLLLTDRKLAKKINNVKI